MGLLTDEDTFSKFKQTRYKHVSCAAPVTAQMLPSTAGCVRPFLMFQKVR
jgi:hypothetical protein